MNPRQNPNARLTSGNSIILGLALILLVTLPIIGLPLMVASFTMFMMQRERIRAAKYHQDRARERAQYREDILAWKSIT